MSTMSESIRPSPDALRKIDDAFQGSVERQHNHARIAIQKQRHEIEQLLRLENCRLANSRNAALVFGLGYVGYGNGWTESKPRILYPKERKRARRHLRDVAFTKESLRSIAVKNETLVPIRLDIDYDKYKLRDTFTWNLSDDIVSAEVFAEQLCEDYELPPIGFLHEIQKSLKSQVAEYHPHMFPDQIGTESSSTFETRATSYTDSHDDDLRIVIKLDITVGSVNLTDQFEWDLNSPDNVPERFADNLCAELGLSSEFKTAIAHAIHEQCQMYTKSLFLVGYSFDGKVIQDTDLRQAIMPPIFSALRPKHVMDQYAPSLSNLLPDQLERIDRDREREGRRNRRQTRGKRGAILPDLTDLPKTYRSIYMNYVLNSDDLIGQQPGTGVTGTAIDQLNDHEESSNDDEYETAGYDSDNTRHHRQTRASRSSRQHLNPIARQHTGFFPAAGSQIPNSIQKPPFLSGFRDTPGSIDSSVQRAQVLPEQDSRFVTGPKVKSIGMDQGVLSREPITMSGNELSSTALRPETRAPEASLIVKLKLPRLRLRQATQHSGPVIPDPSYQMNYMHQNTPAPVTEVLDLPIALEQHIQQLHESFPYDHFQVILKATPEDQNYPPAYRVRCLTCPGTLYYIHDFEVHLNNRTHRSRVEQNQYAST